MTIEQYLELSTDELEKMSDTDLVTHFSHLLPATRPKEIIPIDSRKKIEKVGKVTKRKKSTELNPELAALMDKMGFDKKLLS